MGLSGEGMIDNSSEKLLNSEAFPIQRAQTGTRIVRYARRYGGRLIPKRDEIKTCEGFRVLPTDLFSINFLRRFTSSHSSPPWPHLTKCQGYSI